MICLDYVLFFVVINDKSQVTARVATFLSLANFKIVKISFVKQNYIIHIIIENV